MRFFPYGGREREYLAKRDPRLGEAMEGIGPLQRPLEPDLFQALASSIIGQQISTKAAATLRQRLVDQLHQLEPQTLLAAEAANIAATGIGERKTKYLLQAAQAIQSGQLIKEKLEKLNDQEIIEKLITLPGVGQWTAEMLLIHCFARPDVLSFKDLGIRRGIMQLHKLSELDRHQFEKYKKRYSPYATTASIYLWKIGSKPLA